MSQLLIVLLISLKIGVNCYDSTKYEPTWESIDSRPLPDWYDNAKVGIFIHWGLFSVPAYRSEWFWYYWRNNREDDCVQFMTSNFKPNFSYAEFGPMFTARHFNPDYWASVFQASGAKYVVLTSKHHEGFTLWPSKTSWNWNSMDIGPKRDLVGDLAKAVRKTTLKFGLYHSLFEWFNPLYLTDKGNDFKTDLFTRAKAIPELYDIVNTYKPEIIWSDGDGEAPDTYWKSREWIAWLYNESPVKDTVVTNDRWGSGIMCHHGGFLTCQDRFQPGSLQSRKWENAMTIDSKSWGYVKTSTASDYLTNRAIIKTLVQTVSYGGNLLINIGPTAEGTLPPIMDERLRQMGTWLKVNGEAIYETQPWIYQNDSIANDVYYTQPKQSVHQVVYAILLNWPVNNKVNLGSIYGKLDKTKVQLITPDGSLVQCDWYNDVDGKFRINLQPFVSDLYGWVLKITNPAVRKVTHKKIPFISNDDDNDI